VPFIALLTILALIIWSNIGFGYENLINNLISEVIGIITTLLIINWIFKRSQEKKESRINKALIKKAIEHCDRILPILSGEDNGLSYLVQEDGSSQIMKEKDGLTEVMQLGSTILSLKILEHLLVLIESINVNLSLPNNVPARIVYSQDLIVARNIKTLYTLVGDDDRAKQTDESMFRINYYLERSPSDF
jgi:hypothetical protein